MTAQSQVSHQNHYHISLDVSLSDQQHTMNYLPHLHNFVQELLARYMSVNQFIDFVIYRSSSILIKQMDLVKALHRITKHTVPEDSSLSTQQDSSGLSYLIHKLHQYVRDMTRYHINMNYYIKAFITQTDYQHLHNYLQIKDLIRHTVLMRHLPCHHHNITQMLYIRFKILNTVKDISMSIDEVLDRI